MESRSFSRLMLVGLCLVAAGCAAPDRHHYYWGNYETLILNMYLEPGSVDTLTQIEQLIVDIQQAENNDKAVPPGLYAHLGMIYALNGDVSQAEAAFLKERDLFPEAEVFIDGMMTRSLASREKSNVPAQ